jgi:uncharacterized protein YceK
VHARIARSDEMSWSETHANHGRGLVHDVCFRDGRFTFFDRTILVLTRRVHSYVYVVHIRTCVGVDDDQRTAKVPRYVAILDLPVSKLTPTLTLHLDMPSS